MTIKKITPTSVTKLLGIRWSKKSSPLDLFRAFILFCDLVVAMVAILTHSFDDNVRTFLVTVILYAALTKGQ
jgi:hypothetical protein